MEDEFLSYVAFVTINKLILVYYYHLGSIQTACFLPSDLSPAQQPPGLPTTSSCHVSSGPSCFSSFTDCPCFYWTWQFLKRMGVASGRISLGGNFPEDFSYVGSGYRVREKDRWGCCLHHFVSEVHAMDVRYHGSCCRRPLAEIPGGSLWPVALCPPPSTGSPFQGCRHAQPMLQGWDPWGRLHFEGGMSI